MEGEKSHLQSLCQGTDCHGVERSTCCLSVAGERMSGACRTEHNVRHAGTDGLVFTKSCMNQCHLARKEGLWGREQLPSFKFWAVKKFFVQNFFSLMQSLKLKTFISGKIRSKNEILSTHSPHCWTIAAVCRKIATSCRAYFFNPRRH